ncbi:hypothetical protein BDN67DRAFT_992295 [Paxillus ammoniavirescens]|nr:hypothetical protein BDN67DRAFT_992295 [Paxillus ammoniavirescens]
MVERFCTCAAQKLPPNLDEDDVITHAEFLVNIDQTNIVYQLANAHTYEVVGAKQVTIIGQEDKCACTLLVRISAAGDLLPWQFQFDPSHTATCWSTYNTMCMYVTDILVPFWNEKKQKLGVPLDQPCILQLDCWVIHRSIAFCTWLDVNYEWI